MMNYIIKILKNNAIPIGITIISICSSIVTLFVDVKSQVSVKWLIFIIIISSIIIVLLIKGLYDLLLKKQGLEIFKLIKHTEEVLVIKSATVFNVNILVTVYIEYEGYEYLAFIGKILNIQENGLIVITILKNNLEPRKKDLLHTGKVIIKTSIPYEILEIINER